MATSSSAFRASVERAPHLRRALDVARDRGRFVVVGHPEHWAATANVLQRAGSEVVAFHDLRLESRRLWFRRRPIWRGRRSGPLARYPTVLAGPVRKRYFDGVPASVERCLYAEPMTGWRQRAQHTPDLGQHDDALASIWGHLADDDSRDVFASVVRAREDGDAGYFRVSPYREYAHPVVRARPGDTVIDCGAFWGDSARRFAWQMRGRGTIVALEPCPNNYARLARQPLPGLVPLCLGAWNQHDVLSFSGTGGSAKVDDSGTQRVHVAPIDWMTHELGLDRVDAIKLDVEGAEREALDGARETIERYRPKLMVSIYHRRADVHELPRWVMDHVNGYRFFVGHHGPYHTETDLYAIPEERIA